MEEISSRQTKKRNSQPLPKRLGGKKGLPEGEEGRLVCPSCQLRYIWAAKERRSFLACYFPRKLK